MGNLIGIALWALIPGFVARKKGRSFWGYYFLSFLISPLITTIITLCLGKTPPKVEEDYVSQGTPAMTTNGAPSSRKIRFCCKCGEELLEGGRFCSKCGAEIIRIGEKSDDL